MKWIKADEQLPVYDPGRQILIRYNKNDGEFWDRELGNRNYIKDLIENGWESVEWLDERD